MCVKMLKYAIRYQTVNIPKLSLILIFFLFVVPQPMVEDTIFDDVIPLRKAVDIDK